MDVVKIKALQDVIIAPHGVQLTMEAGEIYSIPADTVDQYVRGKYAEVVEPQRKPVAKQKAPASKKN